MTFLEAVQSLKDGKCKGIKPDYDGAATYTIHGDCLSLGDGSGMRRSAEDLLGDWQLVNPKPQTETVEVKCRICPVCEAVYNDGNVCPCNTVQLIDAVLTYEAPVKPKIKRREEISGWYRDQDSLPKRIPYNATVFAEWQE